MNKYYGQIINVHTHIFPEKIAEKATASIGNFYGLAMASVGLKARLEEEMKRAGVKHCFLLSTATTKNQVVAINDFLIETIKSSPDKFTAFGTIHIDTENPLDEIDRIRKNAVTGIKFHNDFQQFAIDDPRIFPVYEKAQAEKIPIMFHAGDKRYKYTNPDKFVKLSKLFPDLIVIASHFGAYSEWDKIDNEYLETNHYFDTSSSFFELPIERAREIIKRHGEDKFLFGSDFPMWFASNELKYIEQLGFSEDITEKILFKNAEKLLEKVGRPLNVSQ